MSESIDLTEKMEQLPWLMQVADRLEKLGYEVDLVIYYVRPSRLRRTHSLQIKVKPFEFRFYDDMLVVHRESRTEIDLLYEKGELLVDAFQMYWKHDANLGKTTADKQSFIKIWEDFMGCFDFTPPPMEDMHTQYDVNE